MEFDKLSRGQQYLVLLNREYQQLVRILKHELNYAYRSIELYRNAYTVEEFNKEQEYIESLKQDIEYYSRFIRKDGAENEEYLTESRDSESPMDRYTGPTCTTV